MVLHPADYRWSSYRANAQGERNKIITPHFMYEELGLRETTQQASYRKLFRFSLESGLVDEMRKVTKGNFV